MIFLSTLLISMFITMALIPMLRVVAVKLNAMDFPNPRKVHAHPMPKIGGIAMALGALIPVALNTNGNQFMQAVLIGSWIVVIFGVIDDLKDFGYKFKFVGQILAATVVIFYGRLKISTLGVCLPEGVHLPDIIAIPLTLLAIVGVTNAINLSDGLDGLAGGSSLLIFICIGYLAYTGAYIASNYFIVLMSAAAIGAIFGFLRFNTYPATVFMGDSGSQLLGFLAITLSLGLTQCNTPLSSFLPLLLLGFPVLDTLTVMVERISDGKSPFKADKNHFHHKLIRLGLFHTEAVVAIYTITALLVSSAFIFRFYTEWFLLALYLIFSGLVIGGFLIADKAGWRVQRYDLVDKVIKGKLAILKEKLILIKVSFHFVEIVVPLLLVFSCMLPARIPYYYSILALVLTGLTIATWVFLKNWLTSALRISYYLLVPLTLRLGQIDMVSWMNTRATMVYNLSFLALALFVVLTHKFTRRKKGFKVTPMDFLILVIAIVVPNLPDPRIQSLDMGFLATKMIVLFFSFEVLIGELRGQSKRLGIASIAALLLVAIRGII
jgi:UDP-GlcNAc:undecaprenyl-phosphate GlcNAc-1-phosphate transferase